MVIKHFLLCELVLLYQINTNKYNQILLSHNYIKTTRYSKMFQPLNGHILGVQLKHSLSVGQKNSPIYCKYTLLDYFLQRPTNEQLIDKLSHSYIFRHYCVILREFVVCTLPIYASVSNAVFGNKI